MIPRSLLILFFLLTGFSYMALPGVPSDSARFEAIYDSARLLRRDGNYQAALSIYYELLEKVESGKTDTNKSDLKLARIYKSIAWIYLFLNEQLSEEYAVKALRAAQRSRDPAEIEKCFSLRYYTLYEKAGSAAQLEQLADSCIYYSRLLGDNQMLGEAYMHKCNALVELNRIKEAEIFCSKAEEVYRRLDDDYFLASALSNIGNVFLKAGHPGKALRYHQQAHELSKRIGYRDFIISDLANLANDYFLLGEYRLAAEHYKAYSDSLTGQYEERLDKKFTEAEARYAGAVKDREIALRELEIERQRASRNKMLYGGMFLLILLGSASFTYILNQRRKKKGTEEALLREQEMNRLRSDFLENVAHEIRTPVTLIEGYLTLALEEADKTELVRKRITDALKNNRRILSDAEEILELLRLNTGKLPLQKSESAVNHFCRRIFFSFESLAEVKKIALIYRTELPDNLSFRSELSRLEKIMNILLSNAIKYAPSDSEIIWETQRQGDELILRITDSGPGIAADEQEKIFDRFYQSQRIRHGGGVGIGLSLARELCESVHGRISVESKTGEGAAFTLCIPAEWSTVRAESNSIHKTTIGTANSVSQDHGKESARASVLIIEDHPEMAEYLREILSAHYNCDLAFNGHEGIKAVQTRSYDLLISDVMMPGMDGFEFRKKVNEIPNYKNTPFVFITAKNRIKDRINAYELGVDDYVVKPFSREELLTRIRNLLKKKKVREQWIREHPEFDEKSKSAEEELMASIREVIYRNLDNEDFRVSDLAREVAYSQRQLSRLLNKSIGLSPVQYILELRLQRAYFCLQEKKFATLAELRHHVGISSASYFNRKFTERFGVRPSEL